ncbi:MAG: four helix bundle protein [Bacteroidota bacterium]
MTIQRFEEMKVWQDARKAVSDIYAVSSVGKFNRDYSLRDQIQRASVSVMSNIAEGYERNNNREFIKFLGYSKGSIGEVRSLLYVALDRKYIQESEFISLYKSCVHISSQIANFIKYLENRRPNGKKKRN